ncbi:MAG TPA: DNA starvation/stationary phase protection protein Dps [Polyangiaceae bacterium LLY-WYZ-14_1]|nr:DNA starvation/stationary phase protection protein Dps [Polyangiaceae bacterium LLY-WYZ-14_1]
MTEFTTHVGMKEQDRERLVTTLNTTLATTLDLMLQVKQAHWNIRGPWFFARHELFDELAKQLRKLGDDIAERASTLGGYANGTVRLSAEHSELPEYDLKAVDGEQHLRQLTERYGTYTKLLRTGISRSQESNDPATEDLLTEALRKTELDLWFLESHLKRA